MPSERNDVLIASFGPFRFDFCTKELRKHGTRLRLEEKPAQVLRRLLENAGAVVSRQELQELLWPDGIHVDFNHGLDKSINKLRTVLGDDCDRPHYVETWNRQGYRFIESVEILRVSNQNDCRAGSDEGSVSHASQNGGELARVGEVRDIPRISSNSLWVQLSKSRRSLSAIFISVALMAIVLAILRGNPTSHARPIHSGRSPARAYTFRSVYVLDYNKSTVFGYSVNPATGFLEPVNTSPFHSGEHPYSATLTPDRDFLYVANRGRADGACGNGCNVSGYAVEPNNGGLVELGGSPYPTGSGPVSIAVHPSGRFLYVANVISNDLYVYARDAKGDLQRIGSPVRVGTHPFFVTTTPSGQFLYVSNQDDATISAFALGDGGKLKPIPGSPFATGLRPRSITIDPEGRFAYVVNYGVNPFPTRENSCIGKYGRASGRGCTISIFAIDQNTGALSQLRGSPMESDGINPIASVMDAQGKYLFVANVNSNDVSVYEINSKDGAIHAVRGSPFPAGNGPAAVALDWSDEYLYMVNVYSHTVTQFKVEDDGHLRPIGVPNSAALGPVNIVAQRGQNEKESQPDSQPRVW